MHHATLRWTDCLYPSDMTKGERKDAYSFASTTTFGSEMSYNPFANYPAAPVVGGQPSYETPQSALYTGSSDSYSKFHSPADPNARLNLIHAESHRAAFDASMAEQSSIYTPEAASKGGYKHHAGKGKARTTVLRKGGGELWEDSSLMEWDPSQSHFILPFVSKLTPISQQNTFDSLSATSTPPSPTTSSPPPLPTPATPPSSKPKSSATSTPTKGKVSASFPTAIPRTSLKRGKRSMVRHFVQNRALHSSQSCVQELTSELDRSRSRKRRPESPP